MFKKKKAEVLHKRAHLDPKSGQGALQESARNDVLSTAKTTIGLTSQVLGVLPTPVPKAVADMLLQFVTKTEQTINNATTEKDLAQDLASQSAQLQMAISESASPELKAQVGTLVQNLLSLSDYRTASNRSTVRRWLNSADDATHLAETKQKQRDAVQQFGMLATMRIEQKVDEIASRAALQRLAYSFGASWKPEFVCAANTRIGFLHDIQTWIHQPASKMTPRIFSLTGVAGSGKSAVAHSVSQMCAEDLKCTLASSFFFDREVAGRNTPESFLSNLAVDLAARDPQCGAHMSRRLKDDPSLAGSSMKRLFNELIIPSANASDWYRTGKPVVIVTDALDEGRFDISSLQIIREGALGLPATFRFFLTSRPHSSVDHVLKGSRDVRRGSFDLASPDNTADIREFVRQQCPLVADELGLDVTWPGKVIQEQLVTKAQGLFVWIAVVFGYIRDPEKTCDPDDRLTSLLDEGESIGLKPGERMDRLFRQIIQSCPWGDRMFPSAFSIVVGTLLVLETPLSPTAFASYLGDDSEANIRRVRCLGPLISGLYGDGGTVRFIHLSVREFLTSAESGNALHYVKRDETNGRLALRCLDILNQDLPTLRIGVVYSAAATGDEGVPYIQADSVSEELRYACNFWKIHTSTLQDPIPPTVHNVAKKFCDTHLRAWIELSVSLGQLQTLENAPKWVRNRVMHGSDTEGTRGAKEYSTTLYNIYFFLMYDARLEEALQAMKEAVVIRKDLVQASPDTFRKGLSWALNNLSICYGKLGRREEALNAIQESVIIKRELAKQQPAEFNPDLAMSLNNFSNRLSELGQYEEALSAIKESVGIRRQLAEQQPAKFNPDLAQSLPTLSNSLYYLGQKEDALSAIQEAVTIRRELTRERPDEYNPLLALSLTNLSDRLSDLGLHEEALSAAEESLAIGRELAKDRPATFNPDLARTLGTLSMCLDNVGRPEEALSAIEEAVAMYRDLAKERPAAFNEELAISLNNLSFCLSALGRDEEALRASREEVALFRQLADERPVVFNRCLAIALRRLSTCLSKVGRQEEAQSALTEAESLSQ